jgi:hypothetical protein
MHPRLPYDVSNEHKLMLAGGRGITAHSAVLVDVPFFEAKLREEWSGATAWNLHNKLRLRLPCDVSKDALDVFLHYLYGDTQLLYGIDPGASSLKVRLLTARFSFFSALLLAAQALACLCRNNSATQRSTLYPCIVFFLYWDSKSLSGRKSVSVSGPH